MVTAVIRSGISSVKSTGGFSGGKFSRMGKNFEIAALLMAAALLTAAALWGCSGSASAHPADESAADAEAVFKGDESAVVADVIGLKSDGVFTSTDAGELVIRELHTSGAFDVVISEGPGDFETLEIFKDNKSAYTYQAYRLYVGSFEDIDRVDTLTGVGMDVTGDGVPNAVISEWTGGHDACYLSHVFELGEGVRKVITVDGVSECPKFVDLDGDMALEVVVRDWAFRGTGLAMDSECAPEVVLKYRDGGYWVAQDVMHRPASDAGVLKMRAANMQADLGWLVGEAPTKALCRDMLEMIYSGNAEQAWAYCRAAWHPAAPGRREFLAQFRAQLGESIYLDEIDTLNRGRVLSPLRDDR